MCAWPRRHGRALLPGRAECARRCAGLCTPGSRDPGTRREQRLQREAKFCRLWSLCHYSQPAAISSRALGVLCVDLDPASAAPQSPLDSYVARCSNRWLTQAREDSLQLLRLKTLLVEREPLHLTFSIP